MFTGLVEELGTIVAKRPASGGFELRIRADTILQGTKSGDSIMVDGVCLTATSLERKDFSVFVTNTTEEITTLPEKRIGDKVNLERAMAADGRFGGHMVAGHVDTPATIREIQSEGEINLVKINLPSEFLDQMIDKGSVCLDGISLTVVAVTEDYFSVTIIPETWARTSLAYKRTGDRVNIELDLMGKYIFRAMSKYISGEKTLLTMDKLREMGY